MHAKRTEPRHRLARIVHDQQQEVNSPSASHYIDILKNCCRDFNKRYSSMSLSKGRPWCNTLGTKWMTGSLTISSITVLLLTVKKLEVVQSLPWQSMLVPWFVQQTILLEGPCDNGGTVIRTETQTHFPPLPNGKDGPTSVTFLQRMLLFGCSWFVIVVNFYAAPTSHNLPGVKMRPVS